MSFSDKFDLIEVGSSPKSVADALGSPDKRSNHTLPEGPYYGPSEGLTALLKPEESFEEWVYWRNGLDYYVWFAEESRSPTGELSVVLTAKYTHGAVFEPSNN